MIEEKRQFDTGLVRLSFTDKDGVEFASFSVNPTDSGLLARAEEVADFFLKRSNEMTDVKDAAALDEYNSELEKKIDYLLGYDASKTIFDTVTATTISPDGEIFAHAVLEMVVNAIAPELERRSAVMRERVGKYTDRYKEKEKEEK